MWSPDLIGGATSRAPTERRCTACGEQKPLHEFRAHRKGRFGRRSQCRLCERAKQAQARARDPERFRSYGRRWYDRHREEVLARTTEYRRTARGRQIAIESAQRWADRNWTAVLAAAAARRAIKRGELQRAETCQAAGCDRHERLHGHHADYSKPLHVAWLCPGHHRQVHLQGRIALKPGVPPHLGTAPKR